MFKKVSIVLFLLTLSFTALAIGIAASSQFQEQENAIRKSCEVSYNGSGPAASSLGSKYFTPEVQLFTPSSGSSAAGSALSCLKPGSMGEIQLKGKTPEGTKYVIENDDIKITSQSQVAGVTHLGVSVGAGAMPGKYNLTAFAPVTCSSNTIPAVIIVGHTEWHLVASNGWHIDLANTAGLGCSSEVYNKSRQYKASITRGTEAKPFRELNASYEYSVYNKEAHFQISPYSEPVATGASPMTQEQLVAITQKMADPHISQAERQKLIQQIQDYSSSMKKNYANITEQSKPFSCTDLNLKVMDGRVTGTMTCNAETGKLNVTGTYKYLGL